MTTTDDNQPGDTPEAAAFAEAIQDVLEAWAALPDDVRAGIPHGLAGALDRLTNAAEAYSIRVALEEAVAAGHLAYTGPDGFTMTDEGRAYVETMGTTTTEETPK